MGRPLSLLDLSGVITMVKIIFFPCLPGHHTLMVFLLPTTVPLQSPWLNLQSDPRWTFFFLILFIYLFMAVLGLRFCARALSTCGKRGPLPIAARGPPTAAAPPAAEHGLQTRRPSSHGSRAQLLRGTWDPPRPGPEPAPPAPAGRPPTTAPPGKPKVNF